MKFPSRVLIGLTVVAALVAQATPALAARARSPLYTSQNGCANPNTTSSQTGKVRFTREGNEVTARFELLGQPNTSYIAILQSVASTCSLVRNGLFTTDERGKGKVTLFPATVASGVTDFYAEVRLDGSGAFVAQTVIVELLP